MRSLLLVMLAGCDITWSVPYAPVVPVAEPAHADAWLERIVKDVDMWNSLLVERGCEPPFVLSDAGYEIYLVPRAQWQDGIHIGMQNADSIEVRSSVDGTPPPGGTLMHELGHALGMDHVFGRPSLMNEIGAPGIMPGDVDLAAEVMGCAR